MTTPSQLSLTSALAPGHPVNTYFRENDLIHELLRQITDAASGFDIFLYTNIFNQLCEIEKRFARKENQLFPFLEKRGWNGPSQNMWSFHDVLRDQFRLLRYYVSVANFKKIQSNTPLLVNGIYRLMQTEETVLFPNALQILSDEDWMAMRKGEDEIGWMLPEPPDRYPALVSERVEVSQGLTPDVAAALHFDEGNMTIEQANLLLRTIPVDLTFVDENDRVIFYNRGEERVFPRSAGIIGREVRFCHPPKSVGTVLQILEAFRSGERDEAAFWINYKERLIYIRYFAVRDRQKQYRGVVEMSQDVTDIKTLEGEKRLLQWL